MHGLRANIANKKVLYLQLDTYESVYVCVYVSV